MSYTNDARRNLKIEWKVNDGMAKIFKILRDDLDEGSEEPNAWELIFIDGGGVRRHENLIDCAYGRFDGLDEDDHELLASCPDKDIVAELMEYISDNQ